MMVMRWDPIVVPAGLLMSHSFDYSQFPSENDGTPALLEHHKQQLSGFEVQFGKASFRCMISMPERT